MAQHHGLPTRLLDWTYNPLVATFFSIRGDNVNNPRIIISRFKKQVDQNKISPFKTPKFVVYKPNNIASRISRQSGVFSVHPNPDIALDETSDDLHELMYFSIKQDYAQELVFELNHYGFNELNLFPDLDGLSKHMCWSLEKKQYWASPES